MGINNINGGHNQGEMVSNVTVLEPKESLQPNDSMEIVTRYVLYSAGAGILPVPFVDTLIVSAVQLKMISELAKYYKVSFQDNLGKSLIGSLLGGLVGDSIGNGIVKSILSLVPVVGPVLGGVGMAATSGAVTYALGRVFIHHFESGGTLLDFEPNKFQDYFQEQIKKGKDVVKNLNTKK